MLKLRLTPRLRRAPQLDLVLPHDHFIDEELGEIRRELLEHRPLECPRCRGLLHTHRDEGIPGDHGEVWEVECSSCRLDAVIRVCPGNGPRAPRMTTLIFSQPTEQGFRYRAPQSLFSIVIHGVLITAAVFATQGGAQLISEVLDTSVVYLTLEKDAPPEPEPEPDEVPATVVNLNPPPKGFQTISTVVDIPTEIPPIDLSARFDPRDFSGEGVEGGIFVGVEGGTGPLGDDYLTQTFTEAAVDEPPERLSTPPIRYPDMLRQANIEGVVRLEFVVDTTGRAEVESIRVLFASNEAFIPSASDVVTRAIYRPGRLRGQKVRVLVETEVAFNLLRAN